MPSIPRSRPWPGLGVALLLASLSAASPARAQDRYLDQVRTYLDHAQERVLGEGFGYEGESSGWMAEGAEAALVVSLPPGQYIAVGQCDDDCTDLDMSVDHLSGEQVGADREPDSAPVVVFSMGEDARIVLSVTMGTCATQRCYAGFRWYRRNETSAGSSSSASVPATLDAARNASAPSAAASWQDQVLVQFEDLPVDRVTLVKDRLELMEAAEATRFTLTLDAGSYLGLAACDNDCADLDMAVEDSAGQVDSDVLTDALPVVEFEVGERGPYTFEVRMVDCSTSSCGYGFRLYTLR